MGLKLPGALAPGKFEIGDLGGVLANTVWFAYFKRAKRLRYDSEAVKRAAAEGMRSITRELRAVGLLHYERGCKELRAAEQFRTTPNHKISPTVIISSANFYHKLP